MFKNLRIKWTLSTSRQGPLVVMMAALLVMGLGGYAGISTVGGAVNDIGVVRLPSIQGLLMISEGQTAVVAATLAAAIDENNFQAQDKFAEALQLRMQAWAHIDLGRKLYESLPRPAGETVLWKRFLGESTAWKADDDKVDTILRSLAQNRDEQAQKNLFASFYKQCQDTRGRFSKAEATLNEIIELNRGVAEASAKAGGAAVIGSERLILILASLVSVLGIACAVCITRAASIAANLRVSAPAPARPRPALRLVSPACKRVPQDDDWEIF